MKGENGTPVTPDWSLPKPEPLVPADESHLIRGEN